MIIDFLRVKDFCGMDEFRFDPLQKGVTVIEGPNEAGKSCLARALYIVLDELDSSQNRLVQSIRPVDKDVNPLIEAEIESGRYRFIVQKQFSKNKGSTTLTVLMPSPENLTGRGAHNRVNMILAETIDVDLWRALNIIQGEDPKSIPTDSSLSIALNKAAGSAPIGERELNLFETVEKEARGYYSSRGNPDGKYKEDIANVAQQEHAVRELDKAFQEAEREVETSTRFSAELQHLAPERSRLENEKAEREEELQKAVALQGEVKIEEQKEAAIRANFDSVRKESKARDDLIEAVNQAKGELAKLRSRGDYEQELASVQQAESTRKHQMELAESVFRNAREKKEHYQAWKDDFASRQWLEQLNERRARIELARKRKAEAKFILERNRVDDEVLDRIRDAARTVDVMNGKLETNLPMVRVNADKRVTVVVNNGKTTLDPQKALEEHVVESFVLELPKVMRIQVSSGSAPEKAKKKATEAREEFARLLGEYGVGDIEDAIRANHEWQQANSNLERGLAIETQDLRDLTYEELISKVNEAQSKISAFEIEKSSTFPTPSDKEEASRFFKEASDEAQQTDDLYTKAKAEYSESKEKLETVSRRHQESAIGIRTAEGTLKALEYQLQLASNALPSDNLKRNLNEAEAALRRQADSLALKRAELLKHDTETLIKLRDNAISALSGYSSRVKSIEEQLTLTRGKILYHEEQGAFERANLARAQLEQAKRKCATVERAAKAASLLLRVLSDSKSEAQNAYLHPLKDRIERLGKIVYGETFQVELDEELNVTKRTLHGKTIPYDWLSTGTKEQIGLIMKLACAMIVSQDGGMPIIIDDALGHSDPVRINDMAAVIGVAGNECQVILLTCVPDRYTQIGGAKVVSLGC